MTSILLGATAHGAENTTSKADTLQFIKAFINKHGHCKHMSSNAKGIFTVEYLTIVGFWQGSMQIMNQQQNYVQGDSDQRHWTSLYRDYKLNYKTINNIRVSKEKSNALSTSDACKSYLYLSGGGQTVELRTRTVFHENPERSVSSDEPDYLAAISLNSDMTTTKKLLKALQHWWKLKDGKLKDSSLYEDLF